MGKLNFNQKIVPANDLKSATNYKVKKNSIGYVLSDVFNVQNFLGGADTIAIYINGNIDSIPIVALASDPEWVDPATEQNIDNTPLPVGTVIIMNSNLNKFYSGIELVNYNQGKTSVFRSSNFYTKKLSADIDSAIQGVTANDASQLLFSTANPNNGVSPVYTRSTTCWAKNIDTSPTSVWTDGNGGNPRYNANMMTLISPRHGVVANHWGGQIPGANWDNYIGAKFIFVAMDNTCYIRTFTGSTLIAGTDIRVVLLDSDLPPNISFCKVASSSLASLATSSNKIPAMFQSYFPFNLQPGLRAAIADYYGAVIADYYTGIALTPDNATRAAFYVMPYVGDSGRPTCFVYNNKLILLLTFTTTTSGPNFPDYIEQINSAMTALGGGYTLSIFNEEDFISGKLNAKRNPPVAPSGIPVSTINLNINFGAGDPRNGTYINNGSNAIWGRNGDSLNLLQSTVVNGNPTWTFWNENDLQRISPSNPSTDPNFIPIAGWSPSITITAA
jgi:hypothetical protein